MAVRNFLWVVEMELKEGVWEPTVGVTLSRNEGRGVLDHWRRMNPNDKFRLSKYVFDKAAT